MVLSPATTCGRPMFIVPKYGMVNRILVVAALGVVSTARRVLMTFTLCTATTYFPPSASSVYIVSIYLVSNMEIYAYLPLYEEENELALYRCLSGLLSLLCHLMDAEVQEIVLPSRSRPRNQLFCSRKICFPHVSRRDIDVAYFLKLSERQIYCNQIAALLLNGA